MKSSTPSMINRSFFVPFNPLRLLIVFLCILPLSQTSFAAYKSGDWQFWHGDTITGSLTENVSAKLSAEWRFGDDMSELFYYHTEGGLLFKITDSFSLGANYRQVYSLSTNKRWLEERMPNLEFFNNFTLADQKFANRFRVEYRDRQTSQDSWRFRERLAYNLPFELSLFKPYLADELYYEDEPGEINRNWVILGAKFPVIDKVEGDLFYTYERAKSGNDWIRANILNLYLKFKF